LRGVDGVKKNILSIYERKRAAVFGFCAEYAQIGLRYFYDEQGASPSTPGRFWFNRTAQAAMRIISMPRQSGDTIAWRMAHGVRYGVYLELANDRKHEALRPIIQRFSGRLLEDIGKLYADKPKEKGKVRNLLG